MATQREKQIVDNEPHLKDSKGNLISFTEFSRRCHVLTSNRKEKQGGESVRRYAVLFGRNDEGRWKYYWRSFAKEGGKKSVLQRAFKDVKDFVYNESENFALFPNEIFDMDYNRKVPLSF